MNDEIRLDVSNLTKRFDDVPVLSGIDFTVGSDEIVALLGPSGCGKTTTLRCIAGVETPDTGEISIGGDVAEGADVSKPPEDRDVGMVYQHYAIWPHKTVYENVVFPLKYADNPFDSAEYESRVEELLELVEIGELKDEPATDLSGGQQQRTALARALAHDPDLLLLDEPLSNLDKNLRTNMRYELQKLQHEVGVSILYVTHDQEEAFYLADRVLIMDDGEIVERGTPSKLSSQPESPFTRQFLGGWNQLPGSVAREGNQRLVRTDIGEFALEDVEVVPESVQEGAVQCFLRPTAVEVTAADAEDSSGPEPAPVGQHRTDGTGRIRKRGTVITEGILGKLYETTVSLADSETELVVRSEEHHDFARGTEVVISFQPDALKLYGDTPRRDGDR